MKMCQPFLLGSLAAAVLIVVFFTQAAAAQTPTKAVRLPLCGKCLKPTVFSMSGIGTAHAVAKARVTCQDARDFCEWFMDDHPDCDKQAKETLKEENGKVYTATADCVHGRMTIAGGENFVYAGLWPAEFLQSWNSFMKGRTRWRWGPGSNEDTGKIVGFDGPTRAPMVDAVGKILCPDGIDRARK